MSENKAKIKVDNLTVAYGTNVLLKDISFEVMDKDVFIIMGGSGCGKSSLYIKTTRSVCRSAYGARTVAQM